jgi:hypothetical protein
MLTIFKPGDILYTQKEFVTNNYSTTNLCIIGRVLKNDIDTGIIIFDVVIIDGQIKTGLIEFPIYGFRLADTILADSFNRHIKAYTRSQDKAFIDFVDLYEKASTKTKYKIMDYILTAEIKDGKGCF